jgi:hypothetical protein
MARGGPTGIDQGETVRLVVDVPPGAGAFEVGALGPVGAGFGLDPLLGVDVVAGEPPVSVVATEAEL